MRPGSTKYIVLWFVAFLVLVVWLSYYTRPYQKAEPFRKGVSYVPDVVVNYDLASELAKYTKVFKDNIPDVKDLAIDQTELIKTSNRFNFFLDKKSISTLYNKQATSENIDSIIDEIENTSRLSLTQFALKEVDKDINDPNGEKVAVIAKYIVKQMTLMTGNNTTTMPTEDEITAGIKDGTIPIYVLPDNAQDIKLVPAQEGVYLQPPQGPFDGVVTKIGTDPNKKPEDKDGINILSVGFMPTKDSKDIQFRRAHSGIIVFDGENYVIDPDKKATSFSIGRGSGDGSLDIFPENFYVMQTKANSILVFIRRVYSQNQDSEAKYVISSMKDFYSADPSKGE